MIEKTTIIPEIIEEAEDAGCENGNQIIGYLAGEVSRLRGILGRAMPVCPYCKTELKPFDYRGYYESFFGWECRCKELPNAEKQAGQYA